MKLKDIFTDINTKVFVLVNQDDDDELNWTIEPTDYALLPEEENMYFIKAFQVSSYKTADCFLGIITPERIAETVIKRASNGQIVAESIYDQEKTVIPAIASDCFGNYELYYAKENPKIGIDVLKKGLNQATNKNVVAEDLGYILRDEGQVKEAIEAFKMSEENGPSSNYIYLELSQLYKALGQTDEEIKYQLKFKDSSEIE